jgi:multidrug resistance efflux pump
MDNSRGRGVCRSADCRPSAVGYRLSATRYQSVWLADVGGWRALAVGVALTWALIFAAGCNSSDEKRDIVASGTIGADVVAIKSPRGGRVLDIMANEGDAVKAGTDLARFDTALLDAQVTQAQAAVEVAQATRDLLVPGALPQDVAAAETNLAQAQAGLDQVRQVRDSQTLQSPLDGVVLSRSIEPGEIAPPGATLLEVANLDQVQLTVFVPEDEIGNVKIGQKVDVAVDAYPDETFAGQVTGIAQQAEFTPRNVQTKEQRANLVFKVTVTLDNPDQRLRLGMPADATLVVE